MYFPELCINDSKKSVRKVCILFFIFVDLLSSVCNIYLCFNYICVAMFIHLPWLEIHLINNKTKYVKCIIFLELNNISMSPYLNICTCCKVFLIFIVLFGLFADLLQEQTYTQ